MWYKIAFLCFMLIILGVITIHFYKKAGIREENMYFQKILENINRYDGTSNGQKEVL